MTEVAKKTPSGANAPYKIQRRGAKFVVVNNAGDVKASFDTYAKALAYQRALYSNVPGAPKRADKVKFSGKAKDRVPEKSIAEQAAGLPAPHPYIKPKPQGTDQAPKMKKDNGLGGLTVQVIDTDPDCVVCGRSQDNPIHNSSHPDNQPKGPIGEQQATPKINTLAQWMKELKEHAKDFGIAREAMLDGLGLEVAQHSGCMIALFPDPALASDMAIPNGEPAEDLHVTLAYLGSASDLTDDEVTKLKDIVAAWAHTVSPIEAQISGVGFFNGVEDDPGSEDVTYASIDAPVLSSARQLLFDALQQAGLPVAANHGFTPHMTLAYEKVPIVVDSTDVTFDKVVVAVGPQRLSYELTGPKPDQEAIAESELAAEPLRMSDGKYPISDQKSANSAWKLRNHSTTHSADSVVAHIRRACQKLGLKFPGDNEKASEQQAVFVEAILMLGPEDAARYYNETAKTKVTTKKGKHRFVSKDHVKSSVYRGAGWYGGACIACGKPQDDPDHDGDVDDIAGGDSDDGVPAASEMSELMRTLAADDATDADAAKVAAGIDAAVDQALVLLRSCNNDDLPEYAQQARDLLQGIEPACDALLDYFDVPDPDDQPDEPGDVLASAAAEQGTSVAAHAAYMQQLSQQFHTVRDRAEKIDPVPVETVKAFVTEVSGKTILTAPIGHDMGIWEKALSPNPHMLWTTGRFVGADEPNRNGAYWSSSDLASGASTVPYGPLNWLHEGRKIIGCIADQRMVYPTEQTAAAGLKAHIAVAAPVYSWIYPEEAAVIEMAVEQGSAFYSMECVSRNVTCNAAYGGCGTEVSYLDYLRNQGCQHMNERSGVRQFTDPTFLGGAVIVPPARPGWADADLGLMRQAASLTEDAMAQMGVSDLPNFEVERLLAQVLRFAKV